MTDFTDFRDSLDRPDIIEHLRTSLIGDDIEIETWGGRRRLLYADYVASGRALRVIEQFVMERVLPFYANSHTDTSYCGALMTEMREEARATIARLVGADRSCHVLFTGSGATAGLNRIVRLLCIEEQVAAGRRVVVLNGPYEHHSNILPWRETGADVRTVPEAAAGGVDLAALENELQAAAGADLVVGSFSAASNVTGIITEPDPVTRLLKAHGALAVWDYAGGGPYLDMDMNPSPDTAKDAIVFSAHKFPGGPAASGVAVVRDTIVRRDTPTAPGGGTVNFVSPWAHSYSRRVEMREEAGTPNVVGDIRAALAMLVKEAIGVPRILARDEIVRARALAAWSGVPNIRLLGQRPSAKVLPIFSFEVLRRDGTPVDARRFARLLSEEHGVQVRGGCSCAGPYGHQLLGLDRAQSEQLFARLAEGHDEDRPGWVRLNLSYLHSDEQISRIVEAVSQLAALFWREARFTPGHPPSVADEGSAVPIATSMSVPMPTRGTHAAYRHRFDH